MLHGNFGHVSQYFVRTCCGWKETSKLNISVFAHLAILFYLPSRLFLISIIFYLNSLVLRLSDFIICPSFFLEVKRVVTQGMSELLRTCDTSHEQDNDRHWFLLAFFSVFSHSPTSLSLLSILSLNLYVMISHSQLLPFLHLPHHTHTLQSSSSLICTNTPSSSLPCERRPFACRELADDQLVHWLLLLG